MKLHARRLLRALGEKFFVFVGIPSILAYALSRMPGGLVDLTLAAVLFLGAGVVLLRPGWGTWLWKAAALGSPLFGVALGCEGVQSLHLVPDPGSQFIGWTDAAFVAV